MSKRFLEISNENFDQEEKLNNFLREGNYEYVESNNAIGLYAREFHGEWGDEIKDGIKYAMKRLPKEVTDDYLIDKITNVISDHEYDVVETIVELAADEFYDEDTHIEDITKKCARNIREQIYPVNKDAVDKIISGLKNEFDNNLANIRRG